MLKQIFFIWLIFSISQFLFNVREIYYQSKKNKNVNVEYECEEKQTNKQTGYSSYEKKRLIIEKKNHHHHSLTIDD